MLVPARRKLADHITGATTPPPPGEVSPSGLLNSWRNSLFQFRAFKFAVRKLLDDLEEPPEPGEVWNAEKRLEKAEKMGAKFSPERRKEYLQTMKSPETWAASILATFYTHAHRTLPLTKHEREAIRMYPDLQRLIETMVYGIPHALQALELKPGGNGND